MRIVLVTGVTDGIGHALALAYGRAQYRVLGVGRRPFPQSLGEVMAPADYCVADLAQAAAPAAIRCFLDERGVAHLDILIHNAAGGWYGPVAAQSREEIDHLLAVNLYAPIALTHALLGHVRAAHGVIAFMSSVHSALPAPDFAVYTATKAALDGFARSLRVEERGRADVIVLWPGPTRTQLHAKSGVPPARIRAAQYPSAEAVAASAVATIGRRRSQALGATNRLLRAAAHFGEGIVDAVLLAQTRRAYLQTHPQAYSQLKPHSQPLVPPQRHAVVTGAAEGIGRALVEELTVSGFTATGVDINVELSVQMQQELARRSLQVSFLLGDLAHAADVAQLSAQLAAGPAIDFLIHNAGINHVAPFADSDLARQQAVLDINLRAPLQLTAALLRAHKIAAGGTIVFVSSLSHFASYPGAAVYAASKDGLASYARSLAVALAPQGIHVLLVYPGPTRTAHARRYSPDNRREHRRMPPEQVAAAVARALTRRPRVVVYSGPRNLDSENG